VNQHTPGPWKYLKVNIPFSGWEITNSEHVGIARLPKSERAEQDASLIAAAPNMLEACRRIANTEVESMGYERFAAWARNMAAEAIKGVKQ
jgi:hypothetical protein